MNQQFEIPFRLPGLNEIISANRQSPYKGALLKKKTDEAIRQTIIAARVKPVTQSCAVHMTFIEPNMRRDVDNVESAKKFILDALVKSGILQGDSPKHVWAVPSYTRYDKDGGYRVVVTLVENDEREVQRK